MKTVASIDVDQERIVLGKQQKLSVKFIER